MPERRKLRATFGEAYWRKYHPEVSAEAARRHLLRRQIRSLRRRWATSVASINEIFGTLSRSIRTSMEALSQVFTKPPTRDDYTLAGDDE